MQLICDFVFVKSRFFHDAAHLTPSTVDKDAIG